jgi:hypothetical protein
MLFRTTVRLGMALGLASLLSGAPAVQAADPAAGELPLVSFSLGEGAARPGEIVGVPFALAASEPLSMIAWSVEYDPGALSLVDVVLDPTLEGILERVPVADHTFEWHAEDAAGPDAVGLAQASLVMDYQAREGFAVPPGLARGVATMMFLVREGARSGPRGLSFTRAEGAGYEGRFRGPDGPVYNAARPHGRPFSNEDQFEETSTPELEDGTLLVLPIIGDIGIFKRGDANLDDSIDISDPLTILGSLFLGSGPLLCPRTADANSDEALDVSDPVTLLNHLFLGVSGFEPSAEIVSEESGAGDGSDGLTCSL